MRILVDTNIIARSAQPNHAQHQTAVSAVAVLTARHDDLCLAPQNLYEFWVVATRPLGENGIGMTTEHARMRLLELENAFTIVDETPEFRREWTNLVVQHDVKGKAGHDARLVAAMNVHGLAHILTSDIHGFTRYPGITVLTPTAILQAAENQLPKTS